MPPFSPLRSLRECGGFTLVEVMVAALLLGIVITGATSLITTGRTLEGDGSLRSQALRLAVNSMERTTRHYSAYPLAKGFTTAKPNLITESGASCAANQIDSIYDTTSVGTQWTDADGSNVGVDVPYQRICVKINWSCGGPADSIVLRKRIANVLPP